jgi:hypothetical protein
MPYFEATKPKEMIDSLKRAMKSADEFTVQIDQKINELAKTIGFPPIV